MLRRGASRAPRREYLEESMPIPRKLDLTPFGRAVAQLMLIHRDSEGRPDPLTLSELARRVGLPRTTVYRQIVEGPPNPRALGPYADALGVPLNTLYLLAGYAGQPDPEAEALAREITALDPSTRTLIWRVLELARDVGRRDCPPEPALASA